MLNERKNIDELFRHGLLGYEEDMPEYVWDNVFERINGDKHRRRIVAFYRAAAGVAVLLAFGAGWFVSRQNIPFYEMAGTKHIVKTSEDNLGLPVISDTLKTQNTEDTNERFIPETVHVQTDEQQDKRYAGTEKIYMPVNDGIYVENNTIPANKTASVSKLAEKTEIPEDTGHVHQSSIITEIKNERSDIAGDTSVNITYITNESLVAEDTMLAENNFMITDSADLIKSDSAPGNNRTELPDSLMRLNLLPDYPEDLIAGSHEKVSGWEIGGKFVPAYAPVSASGGIFSKAADESYDIQANSLSGEEEGRDANPQQESNMIFSTGIGIQYRFHNAVSLHTGLYYSLMSGSYEHIEVPALIGYTLFEKRFGFYLLGGISTGLLVSQTISHYQPVNLSVVAGPGAGIRILKRVSFTLYPSLNINIPMSDNIFSKRKITSAVVYTGLSYRL
ncbi:MAG: hypothetical protein KJ607_05090 [Bacteroidetes bacterium]|nr:hypothetical protein [Bacteroidota bacterium]